jgi:hypothetical protein
METGLKVDLSLVNAKEPLRALADVTLRISEGDLVLHRCAVFHKVGEPPWAILPRLAIEKQGKRQFVPLIDLPRSLRERVLEALLVEYRKNTDDR